MILDYENYTEQEVNCLSEIVRYLSRLDSMNSKLIQAFFDTFVVAGVVGHYRFVEF